MAKLENLPEFRSDELLGVDPHARWSVCGLSKSRHLPGGALGRQRLLASY